MKQNTRRIADIPVPGAGVTELIVFLKDDCAPSRVLIGALRQFERGRHADVQVIRHDVDQDPVVARAYKIDATPTVMLVQDGHVLKRSKGMMTAAGLRQWVDG